MTLKVMHLAWEFPPYKVGGLAEHVYSLSKAQVSRGIKPIVITVGYGDYKEHENIDGVEVYRFDANNIPAEDFPSWVMQINIEFVNKAVEIIKKEKVNIIHAHDWIVGNAGIILKHFFRLPLIATIHATEHGRRQGIHDDRQKFIHSIEERLAFEAWKVIACSYYMRDEISYVLHVPHDKISVIYNGVFEKPQGYEDLLSFKRQYARDEDKIVLFIGRHVWEKGLDIFVEAANLVLQNRQDVKFVVVGTGYTTDDAKRRVYEYGIQDKFYFTGYVDDDTRDKLYKIAEIVVIPSRYEPFGIVALEAMAYGKVVVASETGGLKEVVKHQHNGLLALNGIPNSFKDQILYALSDNALRERIRKNALQDIHNIFNWYTIADKTIQLYRLVEEEYSKVDWKPRENIFSSSFSLDAKEVKEEGVDNSNL